MLSVSRGVMLFISFVEIFPNSIELFKQALEENYAKNHKKLDHTSLLGHAWLLALMAFVVGIVMIFAIDVLIQRISSAAQEECACYKTGSFNETAMRESMERFTF
jgi:zinc transporter ZupT